MRSLFVSVVVGLCVAFASTKTTTVKTTTGSAITTAENVKKGS